MERKKKHLRIDVEGIEKRINEVLNGIDSEKMDSESKFILKSVTDKRNKYERNRGQNTEERDTEDVWD